MKYSSQKIDRQPTSAQPANSCQSSNSCRSSLQAELEANDKSRSRWSVWLEKLGDIFGSLFAEACEIRIWQSNDRNGQICWHVYNPQTQDSRIFDSESEVRVWFEQQHQI